jgi:hypothetical protein
MSDVMEMLRRSDPLGAPTDWNLERRPVGRLVAAAVLGLAATVLVVVLLVQLYPLGKQPAVPNDSVSGALRVPTFAPQPGWSIASTEPQVPVGEFDVPRSWASNGLFAPADGVVGQTIPVGVPTLPESTIASLDSGGIVLVVDTPLPNESEGPSTSFPARDLPLSLADASFETTWEGQPSPEISRYRLLATTPDGVKVEVMAFFGDPSPDQALLDDAQEILNGLSA